MSGPVQRRGLARLPWGDNNVQVKSADRSSVSLRVSVVRPLRWLLLATALIASACSAQNAPQAPAAPARAPDRFIYVSAGEVPSECYHDLGG